MLFEIWEKWASRNRSSWHLCVFCLKESAAQRDRHQIYWTILGIGIQSWNQRLLVMPRRKTGYSGMTMGQIDSFVKSKPAPKRPAYTDSSTLNSCTKLIVTEILPVSLVARPGLIKFMEEMRPLRLRLMGVRVSATLLSMVIMYCYWLSATQSTIWIYQVL